MWHKTVGLVFENKLILQVKKYNNKIHGYLIAIQEQLTWNKYFT